MNCRMFHISFIRFHFQTNILQQLFIFSWMFVSISNDIFLMHNFLELTYCQANCDNAKTGTNLTGFGNQLVVHLSCKIVTGDLEK